METEECYTYLIECQDHSYYCGWTNHLQNRMAAHFSGQGAKYTKSHPPYRLVYFERYLCRTEAMRREYRIKQWTHERKKETAECFRDVLTAMQGDALDAFRERCELRTASQKENGICVFPDMTAGDGMHPLKEETVVFSSFPRIDVFATYDPTGYIGLMGDPAGETRPVCLVAEGKGYYLAPSGETFFESPRQYFEHKKEMPGFCLTAIPGEI